MKKDCWKLKKDMYEKDNKAQSISNVNVGNDELVIMGGCGYECMVGNCEMSWIIDFGASFYATPNRDFLLLMKPMIWGW